MIKEALEADVPGMQAMTATFMKKSVLRLRPGGSCGGGQHEI
jgi:hypothetical protein